MSTPPRTRMTAEEYAEAARLYLEGLPPEHFMEATTQSQQRAVTVESLTVYHARVFSELLVQYFHEGNLRQVVPDNMLILGPVEERERGSWDSELEPGTTIFWTLEYVSPKRRRKDYTDSYRKYEREMLVPYYLTVEHVRNDLRLHRLVEGEYERVEPGRNGRLAVPELGLEVGWLEGWVRFWHKGELLPITAELDEQNRSLRDELRRRDEELLNRDRQIQQRDQQLQERAQQLQQRDRQLQQRDEQLHEQAEMIQRRDEALNAVVGALRPVVEARARAAGREDILAKLPGTNDSNVLTAWLAELG
jgi:Uma2 family endonuclease